VEPYNQKSPTGGSNSILLDSLAKKYTRCFLIIFNRMILLHMVESFTNGIYDDADTLIIKAAENTTTSKESSKEASLKQEKIFYQMK